MKRELWLTACITTFCLTNAQADEGYPTQGDTTTIHPQGDSRRPPTTNRFMALKATAHKRLNTPLPHIAATIRTTTNSSI